jgi:hypothetical protein
MSTFLASAASRVGQSVIVLPGEQRLIKAEQGPASGGLPAIQFAEGHRQSANVRQER